MDPVISLEMEKLRKTIDRLGVFKGDLSGVLSDGILEFISQEIRAIISVLESDDYCKQGKAIVVTRSFGRLDGAKKTITFITPKQFSGALPVTVSSLIAEFESISDSIARIMRNL